MKIKSEDSTTSNWVRWESSKINLASSRGHAATQVETRARRIIFVGKMVRHGSKRIWWSYFYSGKRGSSDCLRDDSVPMACHFFIYTQEQVAPRLPRAHKERFSRGILRRTSRHNSNIKHLNELLYHGPARCHTRKDWIARFEKRITRRRRVRVYNLTGPTTTALSLQVFCLYLYSPPCFNYSLIWLQAEMKEIVPLMTAPGTKINENVFHGRLLHLRCRPVSSTRHIKTAAGMLTASAHITSDRISPRERIPRVAGDPWPYFTRPCAAAVRAALIFSTAVASFNVCTAE